MDKDLELLHDRLSNLEEEQYELNKLITGNGTPERGVIARLNALEREMYQDGARGTPGIVTEMRNLKEQIYANREATSSQFRRVNLLLAITLILSASSSIPETINWLLPVIRALVGF